MPAQLKAPKAKKAVARPAKKLAKKPAAKVAAKKAASRPSSARSVPSARPVTASKGMPITPIQTVAVIGAGVMGAGIAAHAANAGCNVLLFDRFSEEGDPSHFAKQGLANIQKIKPAALMHKSYARRITPLNLRNDLKRLQEADWVIEAIIENLPLKRSLYNNIAPHLKATAVLSSNTSTLPLKDLTQSLPKKLEKRFIITHFFNPVRYLPLLEVVSTPQTDKALLANLTSFATTGLGKQVITCNDTPGFIGNRLAIFWLHAGVIEALRHNIDVNTADAIIGKPFGIPKTGVFGLLDLVGLDLIPHVVGSLQSSLPKRDSFHKLGPIPALLQTMLAKGLTGRKAKQGFTRKNEHGKYEVLNLHTVTYQPSRKASPKILKVYKRKGLRGLLTHDSAEGRYAFAVMGGVLKYALECVPEISSNLADVDAAIRLGFNWKKGPFQLIDELGPRWLKHQFEERGWPIPTLLNDLAAPSDAPGIYRIEKGRQLVYAPRHHGHVPVEEPAISLAAIKRTSKPLLKNISASLWDTGDGVAVFEMHSKMNTFNPFTLRLLNKSVDYVNKNSFKGLIIYNEASHFSAGANLLMLYLTAIFRLTPAIRWILRDGQNTFARLQSAPFPVVAAPAGMALGGGCEITLHAHHTVAHAELYMGLVEGAVGIVPGWGGCKELLYRAKAYLKQHGPMPAVAHAFEIIATAKVSTSAPEAKDYLYLRPEDTIVMSRPHLLETAKAKVLELAKSHQPTNLEPLTLPGPSGAAALHLALHDFTLKGLATPHDVVVGKALAKVLTGGDKADVTEPTTAETILRLERDALASLALTRGTRARIAHMLKKGKPLRN